MNTGIQVLLLTVYMLSFLAVSSSAVQSQALHDESTDFLERKLKGPLAPSSENKLPVRPVDLRDRNKSLHQQVDKLYQKTKQSKLKLRGELETGGVLSHAEPMSKSPLSRYKGDRLKFFQIAVNNNTNQPMLILGSQSSFSKKIARKAHAPKKTVDATTLEKHDNNLLTPKKKALIGLASLGTMGFAGPLTYEYLTPSEHRKRSLGIALGRDRGRHEVESERFGLRLVMPGDKTIGWAAFKADDTSISASKIYVPVMYPPYTRISEILAIPVGNKPQISSREKIDSKVAK